MNQLIRPAKLIMYCDNCKKTQRHKRCLWHKGYYECRACGEERRPNKNKDGWIDTIRQRRKDEERMKKHEETQKPSIHTDEGLIKWLERMRRTSL